MSKHQKRMSAPRNYPVERKDGAYVVKAQGPHAQEEGVPLVVVLRDAMEYADSMEEAEDVLNARKVRVNGRVRTNPRSTVGFMDVIAFPDIDEYVRVLVDKDGFRLQEITASGAETKLARVDDKTTLKGGVTQLNLASGDNIETGDDYDTRSTLVLSLPEMEIEEEIPLEEGNIAYVRGGKHVGEVAEVVDVEVAPGSNPNTVTLSNGEEFQTVEDNVYMVGADEPEVDIDE